MHTCKLFLLVTLCGAPALSQGAFPLESLTVEGSAIPQPVVMEIAELHLNAPVDKAAIDLACRKLQHSGLFAAISYRYAPGPKKGYAVSLKLEDPNPLAPASIDVPGVDESETWQWLVSKYRRFDHLVPQGEDAQHYLGAEIERHLGARTRGQHLTVRVEVNLNNGKMIQSFQPETLPKVKAVSFAGNESVPSKELSAVLDPLVADADYTDRKFVSILELNLRPVYEQRGYYRVKFTPGAPQWTDAVVSLNVAIAEGAPYQLGRTELLGDALPEAAMIKAAKFPNGKLADWKQIQEGIWEMEKVVKRTGYFQAAALPVRSYDDASHILDLTFRVNKGPLFHFGELTITGLTPDLAARGKQLWKPKTGDPYDYAYTGEFLQDFSRTLDFRKYKFDEKVKKGQGDHVMDIELIFTVK
jgi:hypothetical protein